MGFTASEAVEPLDYDFDPWGPKGTTPEPSTATVERFFRELRELASSITGGELKTDADAVRVLEAMTDEDWKKLSDRPHAIYSKLCQNNPTAAVLRKLPHRVFQAWAGWITGELNPNR